MLLTTIIKYFKEALLKSYLKFGITGKTILELQKLIDNYDVDLNVFFPEFIMYVKRNINLPKQIPPTANKLNDFYKLQKQELAILLKKNYPKLFKKYPHCLEIMQEYRFGENKRILLDNNYKITISTDRKMILCLFDKYKQKSHNLDLINAFFEANYYNLSDEMTNNYPKRKMEHLEKFLDSKEKLF